MTGGKKGEKRKFSPYLGKQNITWKVGEKISIIWIIYTPKVQSVKGVLLELNMLLLLVFL